MKRTESQEITERRFTLVRPVLDVVAVQKSRVAAAREAAALVTGVERAANRPWDGPATATNRQRLAVWVFKQRSETDALRAVAQLQQG